MDRDDYVQWWGTTSIQNFVQHYKLLEPPFWIAIPWSEGQGLYYVAIGSMKISMEVIRDHEWAIITHEAIQKVDMEKSCSSVVKKR